MIKVTVENEEFKNEQKGRFAFVVIGGIEKDADIMAMMVGESSFYEAVETIGKGIGSQIRNMENDPAGQLALSSIIQKSMISAIMGANIETVCIEKSIRPQGEDKR